MADVKWIKITTTMFDDDKIKLIDAMPERDTIFYIWMRLLVQAGKTNAGGYIFLTENVPYTEEMLSTLFNRQLTSIRFALQTLKNFGMIEIADNNLIKVTNWAKHQNTDKLEKLKEQNRQRVANHRAKKKELMQSSAEEICGCSSNSDNAKCNVTVTLRNAIEEEREEDKDIDIEEEREEDKDIDIEEERESIEKENLSLNEKSLELCKYYEQLKPGESITSQLSTLKMWIEDYGLDWTKEAIQICVTYKGKFISPWIKKVLMNWQTEGHDSNSTLKNKKQQNGPKAVGWDHLKRFD